MQTTLANLERQPLLIGALGLAVGAGIACTFPTIKMEGELLGESASAARHKVESLLNDAKDIAVATGEQLTDDVENEASNQGLTTSNAQNVWNDAKQKVRNVAGAAEDSIKRQLFEPSKTGALPIE